MIEKIELLESLTYTGSHEELNNGFACIHMVLDIIATGNEDLINAIENGR